MFAGRPSVVLILLLLGAAGFSGSNSATAAPGSVAAPPLQPITIGPRDDVGKESAGDKAVKGLFSALTGGSGGKSKGPKTRRDPTRKLDYTRQDNPETGLEVGVRAAWTDRGLLLSSRIEESDEKGTFHTVFLQDCAGRRLYPAAIEVYKIWSKTTISVSWSKTTTVDGRVVGSESGGWSDSWTEEWTLPGEAGATTEGPPGIWQQVGYGRAHGGVRQVGTYFNVAADDFENCDLGAFVHVSRPEQDPVVTEALPFTLHATDRSGPVTVEAGYAAALVEAGAVAAEEVPCEEGLLDVERKKSAFLAQLDDPARLLAAAMEAAAALGEATRDQGLAAADAAAEQATADRLREYLEAWDSWFEQRLDQKERRREARHGSREPPWAEGSRARAERRHRERSAEMRQQAAERAQKAAAAQQAAAQATAAREAAQQRFDAALDAFARALAALRNAKDEFVVSVETNYRCSPCRVIAGHWRSAARLKNLLDQLAAMLGQRRAAVDARLQVAQQAATAAAQQARTAQERLQAQEQRRGEIEQELRDAVDTDGDCLSLEPKEGWGWMNLASMDETRGSVVSAGAAMAWRSRFKGIEVRVWVAPGCLRSQIEEVNWRKVNELNRELHDLQDEIGTAAEEAAAAQRVADRARAEADGLQAERDALDRLQQALDDSGLDRNTDDVLQRLDDLSSDCDHAIKDEIRRTADARRRQDTAEQRIARAAAQREAARRRAARAAGELGGMDPGDGDDEDRRRHRELTGRADELADDTDDEPPATPARRPTPPDTVDAAEAQRRQAEEAARRAEQRADEIEEEVRELDDGVRRLEDETGKLNEHLRAWRQYRAALAAYEDCLRRKQRAIEELAELNQENASALRQLADELGAAADSVGEAGAAVGELGRISERAGEISERLGEIADVMQRIGNAMEVIDSVMRRDELTPAEKLEAMSQAFEEVRQWLPELPGVSEMLEFYNEAMKAIAGKLAEIQDIQIERWAELVEAGVAHPEDAPVGIREEVRKAARIRALMRIITRNCGNPPAAPPNLD